METTQATVQLNQAQFVTLKSGMRIWTWNGLAVRVGKRGRLPVETITLDDGSWIQLWDGKILRYRVESDPVPGDYLWTGEIAARQ